MNHLLLAADPPAVPDAGGSPWALAILTLAGVVITAVATVAVARFTARSAKAAQEKAAQIEESKVDALAYQRARDSYDASIKQLQEQIDRLKQERSEDRADHASQQADLRERITSLERRLTANRESLQRLADYARILLALLRENGISAPMPPNDIYDHF